jgi:hypothetical protein
MESPNGEEAAPASGSSVVFAPNPVDLSGKRRSIFLAGSIDKGNWQTEITNKLSNLPVIILNPRRTDWDSSWKEDVSFEPFREQVKWEHDMLEAADVIALYFSPEKESPISLLEFGLFARSGKLLVACPPTYSKRGYVQIVCQRLKIELVDTVNELVECIEGKLRRLPMDATVDTGMKRIYPEKLSELQHEPQVSVSEVAAGE